jgi:hypothetical protein
MAKDSTRRRFQDRSPRERAVIIVTAVAQLALAAAAWYDLARRPREQVRGPKWRWALVIAINWAGPITYFVAGRMPGDGVEVFEV